MTWSGLRPLVPLLFFAVAWLPSRAEAGVRMLFDLGVWGGSFAQSDSGHSASFPAAMAPALEMQFGGEFSHFFIEYNLDWMQSGAMYNDQFTPAGLNDASYYSALGLNAGFTLPLLPIEGYVGYEYGNYKLAAGTNARFSGNALKLGVNVLFGPRGDKAIGGFGLKGEFRRLLVDHDDSGKIPSDVSTHADVVFVGLSMGLR